LLIGYASSTTWNGCNPTTIGVGLALPAHWCYTPQTVSQCKDPAYDCYYGPGTMYYCDHAIIHKYLVAAKPGCFDASALANCCDTCPLGTCLSCAANIGCSACSFADGCTACNANFVIINKQTNGGGYCQCPMGYIQNGSVCTLYGWNRCNPTTIGVALALPIHICYTPQTVSQCKISGYDCYYTGTGAMQWCDNSAHNFLVAAKPGCYDASNLSNCCDNCPLDTCLSCAANIGCSACSFQDGCTACNANFVLINTQYNGGGFCLCPMGYSLTLGFCHLEAGGCGSICNLY